MKEFSFRLINDKKCHYSLIKISMSDEDYSIMLDDDTYLISDNIVENAYNIVNFCNIEKLRLANDKLLKEYEKNRKLELKIKKHKNEIIELKNKLSDIILFD